MDANAYHHHNGHNTTLHTPSNRTQPLNPQTPSAASLNDRLNTSYIDIAPDDSSMCASLTRFIVDTVGTLITPRQMLGVLRVLKAITLSFLVLTIAADLMYICLLEVFAKEMIRKQVGGSRDLIIRVYGLLLSFLAIGVEFDIGKISKNFLGLKGFVPRGMLLFFIATLTRAHPIADSLSNAGGSNNKSGSDDVYAAADDNAATDDYTYKMQQEAADLPYSAIAFQQVTSYVLGLCAVAYFVFGLLCFDRFTSKAFLSTKNPLVTTAIPQPNGAHVNTQPVPVYREGNHQGTSTAYSEDDSGDEMT